MKRTFTATAAAAIASALAFGVTAPAASAAPKDKAAHVRADKSPKTAKVDQASRRLAADQRVALRQIASTDRQLAGVGRSPRLAALAPEVADVVLANVALDRDALAELKAAVEAADSTVDLRQVARDVRQVRVANYLQVLAVANGVAEALAQVEENDLALADLAAAGTDVTAAQADNDAAATAASAALDAALTVTASSDRAVLAGARAELTTARELLEAVEAFLAEQPAEQPVTEQPVTEEPVTEEPVV